jgi:dTDP-4-amino-4,6-dideoxygalactose transaminase
METAIKDRIAKTGRKPKAIVPVALYGMPYQIDRIMEIADRYGIPVIEDAAEGFGSRYKGQVLGTFGQYGVLSFNGNKMITTSGGGALICPDMEARQKVMWLATQTREGYPYYQHEAIGYNSRMSNICAGIGRGQMTVVDGHIAHHQHIHELYCELLKDVKGITVHSQPHTDLTDLTDRENFTDTTETTDYTDRGYDSNYWLTTILLDEDLRVKHEERAYAETVKGAVGGAAGMVHQGGGVHTDCEPGNNVEAMRLALDSEGIESRPLWKPMHRQPVFREAPAYVNGVSEALFKKGLCLPSGPMVSDDDVKRIVKVIKDNIVSE